MRVTACFALVLVVVAMISMSRIAVGHTTGLGLAVAKLLEATGWQPGSHDDARGATWQVSPPHNPQS